MKNLLSNYLKASLIVIPCACIISGCSGPASTSAPSTTGNPSTIKVVIYSDPQCHACYRLYTEIEPQLNTKYGSNPKVSIETRYTSSMGSTSSLAAQAMLCAGDQGKYTQYREAILTAWNDKGADAYTQAALEATAGSLGLNTQTFNSSLESGKYRQAITDNTVAAGQLNIDNIPTIFVNDTRIVGVQALDVFTSAIDSALNK
ncbi:MAG: thioredoxin domain-containing protein [Dehalogenimonas sp.]